MRSNPPPKKKQKLIRNKKKAFTHVHWCRALTARATLLGPQQTYKHKKASEKKLHFKNREFVIKQWIKNACVAYYNNNHDKRVCWHFMHKFSQLNWKWTWFLIKTKARGGGRSCRNTHCSRYSLSSRMASVLFPWAFSMEILRFLAACRAQSKQD